MNPMDLSFIIVFGTRWHFRPVPGGWAGVLSCPDCRRPELFRTREAFKAFTLYWFPLVRTEEGGQVVECGGCSGHFVPPDELEGLLSPEPSA